MPTTYLATSMWTDPEEQGMIERLSNMNSWNGRLGSAGFAENTVLATEGGGPVMGVEMEISTNEPDLRKFTLNSPIPFIYGKSDSSISTAAEGQSYRNPYELVSIPADWAHQRMNWASIFKANKQTDIYRGAASTNGLHVHLSVENFEDDNHRKRFVTFLTMNCPTQKAFLIAVSQRTEDQFNRYSGLMSYSVEEMKEMPYSIYSTSVIRRNSGSGSDPAAVFTRYGTIEVRLFRGVWNFASFLSSLSFVSELVEWTRDKTWEQMFETSVPVGRMFFDHVLTLDDSKDNVYLKAAMQAIQPCFNAVEQAETLEDITFCRRNASSLEEGCAFYTAQGAAYAVQIMGESVYQVVHEAHHPLHQRPQTRPRQGQGRRNQVRNYVVRYRDDVFSSDTESGRDIQDYMTFTVNNTTLPRVEELSDTDLDNIAHASE